MLIEWWLRHEKLCGPRIWNALRIQKLDGKELLGYVTLIHLNKPESFILNSKIFSSFKFEDRSNTDIKTHIEPKTFHKYETYFTDFINFYKISKHFCLLNTTQ